jgi:hypothetical protein
VLILFEASAGQILGRVFTLVLLRWRDNIVSGNR